MWNYLLYTVFGTGTLDGFKGAVNHWYFPELSFLQFSVAQELVGLRKQFINNFVFPTWACAAGFNNNNNDDGAYVARECMRLSRPNKRISVRPEYFTFGPGGGRFVFNKVIKTITNFWTKAQMNNVLI